MRYISRSVISFSIRVKSEGRCPRISFTSLSTGGSTFSTNEPKVIEAMESSPMYGKVYFRAPECVKEDVKETKKAKRNVSVTKKTVEVKEVSSWQDAVEYLVSNHGSDASSLTTPILIAAEAEKAGVTFPNL